MKNEINKIRETLIKIGGEIKRRGLKVLQVEAKKSIDLNFNQGGRPEKWTPKVFNDRRAILTGKTGNLQIRTTAVINESEGKIVIGNKLPYGKIHNEGGKIAKTLKMRAFFWAMYYASGGGKKGVEDSGDALIYKKMALSKNDINIPKREYLIIPSSDFPRILNNMERVIKTIRV